MTRDQALDEIRNSFSDITIERVVIEYDPALKADIARVFVRVDQLERALEMNGARARRAAMLSGFDVEVLVA